MKASVSEECIGCGLCESTCPEVFAIGDEGTAEAIVDEVPEENEDSAELIGSDQLLHGVLRQMARWGNSTSPTRLPGTP